MLNQTRPHKIIHTLKDRIRLSMTIQYHLRLYKSLKDPRTKQVPALPSTLPRTLHLFSEGILCVFLLILSSCRGEFYGAKQEQTGPNGAKRSQTDSKGTKGGQTGPNGAKQNQMELNGTKRGQTGPNGAKRG